MIEVTVVKGSIDNLCDDCGCELEGESAFIIGGVMLCAACGKAVLEGLDTDVKLIVKKAPEVSKPWGGVIPVPVNRETRVTGNFTSANDETIGLKLLDLQIAMGKDVNVLVEDGEGNFTPAKLVLPADMDLIDVVGIINPEAEY